jgi:hypothetical protein
LDEDEFLEVSLAVLHSVYKSYIVFFADHRTTREGLEETVGPSSDGAQLCH